MKKFLLLLILGLTIAQARAEQGKPAEATGLNGQLRIVFSNHIDQSRHTDSVLVVFDRYDHTAPGVIKKVFYANGQHVIDIGDVPPGRYYVSIQCLGMHHDYSERVVRVQKGKPVSVKMKLADCEMFSKEKVVIPGEQIDLNMLSVVKG